MIVTIVGTGYVGLVNRRLPSVARPSGTLRVDRFPGTDQPDPGGKAPFYEPGLEHLCTMPGAARYRSRQIWPTPMQGSEISLIAVGRRPMGINPTFRISRPRADKSARI